ncbi:MAG: hypothetical protein HYW65_01140 [Candidatus Liptonbacteria bacterium]|nr:hypothetical protein [Candidatus Liptonbacteria bacterium]
MTQEEQFAEIIKKVEELKRSGTVDLSTEEDLSIAVMNLISLEEHMFFTHAKTQKPEYLALLGEVREMRKELLGKMVARHEGETWCITKHLLAATMRLMEVGTKLNGDGKKAEAKEMFARAYKTYSMFWALRLKLIGVPGFKEVAREEEGKNPASAKAPAGKAWTFSDIVDKLVDCCDE